ncbi:hypothetical protein RD792_007330 [Penstemon davidsonii]|uniref:J domain-containing protein n=1 Tax=Penstemon davidsonii TaxID=160366 RepID=A0ABR0D657_9LAMI|nr:hypothetical protein RD792_007330 [Penstemon davidsonii]
MLGSLTIPQSSFSCHRGISVRASMTSAPSPASAAVDRKSLYEVLRVKCNASQVEIKTAYRTLAKLYHPDAKSRFMESSIATSTDGGDFIEIHKAYATLSDPDARADYDWNLNVNTQRRFEKNSGRGRFYQSRRWETDQCW